MPPPKASGARRCVDAAIFRRRLEKACESAVHDARAFPGEETFQRAAGRLDGLLHGAAAVLLSLALADESPVLLEEAREIVGRFRTELSAWTNP